VNGRAAALHIAPFVTAVPVVDVWVTGRTGLHSDYDYVLRIVDEDMATTSSAVGKLHDATEVVEGEYETPSGVNDPSGKTCLGCCSISPGSIAAKALVVRYYYAVSIYDTFGGGSLALPAESSLALVGPDSCVPELS
jgi:hypothetical protein